MYMYIYICGRAVESGTPAAEPEISLGAPLAEAKSTHRKTRPNSEKIGTGSAASANPAQMAEVDPVVQMAQKNVPARHLPSHSETLVRLGLRLHNFLNICKYGFHKQVFRLRETTTFRRLEFMLDSGPQKRSSRARKTPTFTKM